MVEIAASRFALLAMTWTARAARDDGTVWAACEGESSTQSTVSVEGYCAGVPLSGRDCRVGRFTRPPRNDGTR
ncbi:MAG: hypothetical protein LBL66_04150 [Clostridiales bacterium]|nr:hypothetical protein [Clostridiales bacterium]